MIISLKEYKDEVIYFSLFDILIKKVAPNRDIYLEDMDISPTTYKRCKNRQSKKGRQIIEQLSDHFGYKIPTNEFIDELEKRINKIYHNIYYKIESKYEEDMQYLEDLLKENYLLFPIIKLVKLLVHFNCPDDTKLKFSDNKDLFSEVKEYILFFNYDLLEFYEIFNVLSLEEVDSKILARDYKNELCYSALATKLFKQNRFVECLYLSEKIKRQYLKDENFKRLYSINLNIMACYNSLEEYQQAYDLTSKQMLSLESLELDNFHYETAEFHHLVACLGLGKYQEIIDILDYRNKYSMRYTLILLLAKYMDNINEYIEMYNYIISYKISTNMKELLEIINDIIINEKRENIYRLNDTKYTITHSLFNIVKKMFGQE